MQLKCWEDIRGGDLRTALCLSNLGFYRNSFPEKWNVHFPSASSPFPSVGCAAVLLLYRIQMLHQHHNSPIPPPPFLRCNTFSPYIPESVHYLFMSSLTWCAGGPMIDAKPFSFGEPQDHISQAFKNRHSFLMPNLRGVT